MSWEDLKQNSFALSDLFIQLDFKDSSVCILMPRLLIPLTMTALGSKAQLHTLR